MLPGISLILCFIAVSSFRTALVNGQCGQSLVRPQLPQSAPAKARIINGSPAVPNSWPWTVHIFYESGDGQGFMCGGSLINPSGSNGQSDMVLTAAHCVMNEDGSVQYDPSGFTVTLGAQDISNLDEQTQIRSQVIAVLPHESYNPSEIKNDVAILKLASPIRFSKYVQPICLPSEEQRPANPSKCYAVGWGRISNDESTTADKLQQTLLPILPDSTCASDDVWGSQYDPSIMLCAGYLNGSKSTCQGDSGGPLVCIDGNHFTLFGSTSFGNGELGPNGIPQCATANKPAVFARTSSFVSWIQDQANSV